MKDFAEQTVVIANLKSEAGEKPGVTLQIVGQDDPLPFARAVQSGIVMNGIFVEANDGEIEARLRDDHRVPEVAIPNDMVERRKFLAAWSERARKAAKNGLGISVLLLPLAACGGGGGSAGGHCARSTANNRFCDRWLYREWLHLPRREWQRAI